MARMIFGGGLADWTFGVAANGLQLVGGVTILAYSAETGGTQYTDLRTIAGVATSSVTSSNGSDGRAIGTIPPFYGPDLITEMWVSAGGGPRARMTSLPTAPGSAVLNVKTDFGAVGDGIANDTAAITAALTALNGAGGGTLVFPRGRYSSLGGHTIPPYCHIVGEEPAGRYWVYNASVMPPSACSIHLRSGSTAAALFNIGAGATAFSIRDITLLGGRVGSGIHGISFTTPTQEHNLIAENVAIIGFSGDGIRGRLFATRWSRMFVASNTGYGLNATASWTDTWFTDSIVTGNVSGGVNFGAPAHSGEIVFTSCRFERSGWDPGNPTAPVAANVPGIRIRGSLVGASFIACSTDANSGNGLEIVRTDTSYNMHHLSFVGCRFNRDGFGTMAGSTAPDFATVKVVGVSGARIGYISFTGCITTEGRADDVGSRPTYLHAKYGLWLEHTDYLTWHGGGVSPGHPGAQYHGGAAGWSSNFRASIIIPGPSGQAVMPVWTTANRPEAAKSLKGSFGYNETTTSWEFFNGTSWATVGTGVAPPPPPITAYPTAATVGYIGSEGSLTPAGAYTLTTPNTTYTGVKFDCQANGANWVAVNATGVKLVNCVIIPGLFGGVVVGGSGSLIMEDCTIRGGTGGNFSQESAVGGGDFTLLRCKILSGGDCVDIDGDNVIVQDCFLEQHPLPGAHSDGIQILDGAANCVINHNTITQRGTPSTSPIFWSGAPGPAPQITNNLLVGGAYTIRLGETSGAGAVVTNNVIARDEWQAGTAATFIPAPNGPVRPITWSGNLLGDVNADYTAVTNLTPLALP